MAGLVRAWGHLGYGSNRSYEVRIVLPWPERKLPVVEAHCRAHGLRCRMSSALGGWSIPKNKRKRYARPQTRVCFWGPNALGLVASLGWTCGHPRKDQIMRTWKMLAERRGMRRRLAAVAL